MNPFLRGAPRATRPANVGHRGAMGLAPENTLESFELAFDLGATMVELDVHATKDGALVVHHDDRLDRTTDARARWGRAPWISEVSSEELSALDAGTWFVKSLDKPRPGPFAPTTEERARLLGPEALARYASGRVRVPTLEAVLELVKRRGALVNVELKQIPRFYPGLVARAVALVKRLGMEERVLFSSFDHQAIAEAKKLAPEIPGACLEVSRLHEPGRYVAQVVGGDGWNPGCIGEADSMGFDSVGATLDAASIANAHEHGVFVHVWTENHPDRMRALAQVGVDAIITDFPNRLAAVLG